MKALGTVRQSRWAGLPPLVALVVVVVLGVAGCAASAESTTPEQRLETATATPVPQVTPAPSSSQLLTYVAVGASDAFGIGTADPENESWPVVLARRLSSQTHLINLGIPGATVDLAERLEAPVAVASNPDIITIWLGVNDLDGGATVDFFIQHLRTLIATLKSGTTAHIYVANLPDLTLLPHFAHEDPRVLRAKVLAWNTQIARVCAATGATLIDLYIGWSELARHPEYVSEDGFHPSTAGAARLAEVFFTAIEGGA